MSGRLRDRVAATVVERGLWEPGHHVAVAVSGGLDSVCLLVLLHRTRGVHGATLSVVTLDHGSREGSAADAAWVQALATSLGLPCRRFDLALGAVSEAQLREGRYAAFEGLDVDRIALAHHRDDNAETVLLAAIRGSGTRGLAGMAWRRGRYVRPLLDIGRDELHAWAERHELSWRDDPTNDDTRFLRNALRQRVLPELEALRPGVTASLARAARHAAADADLLDELAGSWEGAAGPPWRITFVLGAPEPIVRRVLIAGLPGAESGHVDAVLSTARRGRGEVMLPDGARVAILDGWVRLRPRGRPPPGGLGL